MPTVLRLGALRVVVYPNDPPPPHVHIIGPAGQAVFNLGGEGERPSLRESFRFTTAELNRIAAALQAESRRLRTAWEQIHGPDR